MIRLTERERRHQQGRDELQGELHGESGGARGVASRAQALETREREARSATGRSYGARWRWRVGLWWERLGRPGRSPWSGR
nr:hypothetical protein [Deltaproteobacteria bacterium]